MILEGMQARYYDIKNRKRAAEILAVKMCVSSRHLYTVIRSGCTVVGKTKWTH